MSSAPHANAQGMEMRWSQSGQTEHLNTVQTADFSRFLDGFLLDCQYRHLSERTLGTRREFLGKFHWWLRQTGKEAVGTLEVKEFLVYVANGHKDKAGRWGNAQLKDAVRPSTVRDYFVNLRIFFKWLVTDGHIDKSPMEGLKPPTVRSDHITPFTEDQVAALLTMAKRTNSAKRDEAILLFLLDTGIRCSELCQLRMGHLDMLGKQAVVTGKGNKQRKVYFSRETGKALNAYLRGRDKPGADAPVFPSERGECFTRYGLLQLIQRLGKAAGIEAVRCSPHTFRHTAAVWFLRSGGQVFALREMLGHTDLKMTSRYVAVAQADVAEQHRQFSPVDRLKSRKR